MKNGFTLIEITIAIIIIAIGIRLTYLVVNKDTQWSFFSGWTEKTCINGMLFVKGRHSITQILDSAGHGIPCKLDAIGVNK